MLDLSEIRARAKRAVSEEFPDGPVHGSATYYCITSDVPALCDEVERLMEENESLDKEYRHYRRLSEEADQQVAVLGRALEMSIRETSAALDRLASHGNIKITKMVADEEQMQHYIERAREETEK